MCRDHPKKHAHIHFSVHIFLPIPTTHTNVRDDCARHHQILIPLNAMPDRQSLHFQLLQLILHFQKNHHPKLPWLCVLILGRQSDRHQY